MLENIYLTLGGLIGLLTLLVIFGYIGEALKWE